MAYEKHTWETGETITAEKLNNLEDGIGESKSGDVFIVKFTQSSGTYTADKTFSEVNSAIDSGRPIIGFIAGFDQYVLPLDGRSGDDLVFASTNIYEASGGKIRALVHKIILHYNDTVTYQTYSYMLAVSS